MDADRDLVVCRKGLYPIDSFPKALGSEAAGEIVALPTDEKILNDEEFKLRKFAVGGKVAVVRLCPHPLRVFLGSLRKDASLTGTPARYVGSILWARSRST